MFFVFTLILNINLQVSDNKCKLCTYLLRNLHSFFPIVTSKILLVDLMSHTICLSLTEEGTALV